MIRRDMPGVMAIENRDERPWAEEDFLSCLRQRNCIGMVSERGNQIEGFMVYTMSKGFLEVLNFAVHPESRWQGIGSAMVEKLKVKLFSHRLHSLCLTVRETNHGFVRFMSHHGFKAVRLIRNCYDDTGEDGYRMIYSIE